jgi:hypothetical protein
LTATYTAAALVRELLKLPGEERARAQLNGKNPRVIHENLQAALVLEAYRG